MNKYKQKKLANEIDVPYPETFFPENAKELEKIADKVRYPVFVKGLDSSTKGNIFKEIKGFVIKDKNELIKKMKNIFQSKIKVIIQEVIPGPDTSNFEIGIYISKEKKPMMVFTFQKIRQCPINFGVGSAVESIEYPKLIEEGLRFFKKINYLGPGNVEFKLDKRNGKLTLIELNTRNWQQTMLSDACGMNFPLIQYLDLTEQNPSPIHKFKTGIKWVNIFRDFESFSSYRKLNKLSLFGWIRSLKGKKVFSDFAMDDPLPALSRIRFGMAFFKLPKYLHNHFSNRIIS
jgi:predicted ATP-grasp superfamily ATP-dependent carboligase